MKIDAVVVAERVTARHGDSIVLVGPYKGMNKPTTFRCSGCAHTWDARPANVVNNGSGCPSCWQTRRSVIRQRSHADYVKELALKHPRIQPLETYTGAQIAMRHRCVDCDTVYVKRPCEWLSGSGCLACSYLKRASDTSHMAELELRGWLRDTFNGNIILRHYAAPDGPTPLVCELHCVECANTWQVDRWNFRHVRPHCPYCNVPRKHRKYVFASGREELVLGYEHYALDYLLFCGVNADDIACGKSGRKIIPTFTYKLGRRTHRYYPDILIGERRVVEVKGRWTFVGSPEVYKRNVAKALAVRQTHRFDLLLFADNGVRIPLPRNWTAWSYRDMRKLVYARVRYATRTPRSS